MKILLIIVFIEAFIFGAYVVWNSGSEQSNVIHYGNVTGSGLPEAYVAANHGMFHLPANGLISGPTQGGAGGGGATWTETIRVDNPDGTYSYKYKDHTSDEAVVGSGIYEQQK